jgi:lipid-A-disaccharide synthase
LRLVNLSHFTLPNLMTELPLVPEFIQEDAQPAAIADAVAAMLDDPERRRLISDEFAKLRQELALDADQRAAESVLALAQS